VASDDNKQVSRACHQTTDSISSNKFRYSTQLSHCVQVQLFVRYSRSKHAPIGYRVTGCIELHVLATVIDETSLSDWDGVRIGDDHAWNQEARIFRGSCLVREVRLCVSRRFYKLNLMVSSLLSAALATPNFLGDLENTRKAVS
jgi:hypothetical protein